MLSLQDDSNLVIHCAEDIGGLALYRAVWATGTNGI